MNGWEKFNKTTLSEKEGLNNNWNMEDITDATYLYAKRVCKESEINNLDEYYYLHCKTDTLLLGDVFENFRKICLKIYDLDLLTFFDMASSLTEVKLELLSYIDMLLMVEKEIRWEKRHVIHR